MTNSIALNNRLNHLQNEIKDEMYKEFCKVDEMEKEIQKLKTENADLFKTISKYAFELSRSCAPVWIDTTHTLPNTMQKVLVLNSKEDKIAIAVFTKQGWSILNETNFGRVDYWMPIPEQPIES